MFYYEVSNIANPLNDMMDNAVNRSLQEFDEYGYGGGPIIMNIRLNIILI